MGSLKTRFAAEKAKSLRANMTDAERRLWSRLRGRGLSGFKFIRQYPVGPYIADFACRQADLVIELDGSQHAQSLADAKRTEVLADHGYRVLRFWNNDVLYGLDGVLATIAANLEKAPSPGLRLCEARPLPPRER